MAIDDKLAETKNPLGYVSIHFNCKMKREYTGPRYEKIADLPFEIQLRTLCMHCWAAVSHHLDYKGDWDVPADLKLALNALGGLFYVADNQFEQFHAARMAYRAAAEIESKPASKRSRKHRANKQSRLPHIPTEINLDTVSAYLASKFPDREQSDQKQVSEFVQELKNAGYDSLPDVNRDVDRARKAFNEYEKAHPPASAKKFASIGVARTALELVSENFRKTLLKRHSYSENVFDTLLEYRKYLEPAANETTPSAALH